MYDTHEDHSGCTGCEHLDRLCRSFHCSARGCFDQGTLYDIAFAFPLRVFASSSHPLSAVVLSLDSGAVSCVRNILCVGVAEAEKHMVDNLDSHDTSRAGSYGLATVQS